jgi:6-pyruvoyl tetrahydropterin synthase/QueD family protein
MFRITKDLGYFAASHNLPDHDGGCYNLHGHNYGVRVTLVAPTPSSGEGVPYSGMLIDFTHIKDIYKQYVHEILDHAHIIADKWPQWYELFVSLVAEHDNLSLEDAREQVDLNLGKVAHINTPDTTAEWLSYWIYNQMQDGLTIFMRENNIHEGYETLPRIESVTVTETETSFAEYRVE